MNIPNWAPATGPPAGGAPAAGVGGGVSAERIPRGKPPNLARRGEIATKAQELRPALSCEPLPSHVLPLGNVDCLPGTQVPRGFYLIELKLNYSLTLESEKDTRSPATVKLASWFASLSAVLQKLVCAVRGFASWQSQQRRLGSPYGASTSHGLARPLHVL
jgi:hypothetical protein